MMIFFTSRWGSFSSSIDFRKLLYVILFAIVTEVILDNCTLNKFSTMSGLLTQVVRRQALMMTPRRNGSALLIAGPPLNKVTNSVNI